MKKLITLTFLFMFLGTISASAVERKEVTLPDGRVIVVGEIIVPTAG